MWIFAKTGFVSIVANGHDELGETLLVRGRIKQDVLNFIDASGAPGEVTYSPDRDYAWRATMMRSDVDNAVSYLVRSLHYQNFKNEVHEDPKTLGGRERNSAYARVWGVMYDIQEVPWHDIQGGSGGWDPWPPTALSEIRKASVDLLNFGKPPKEKKSKAKPKKKPKAKAKK